MKKIFLGVISLMLVLLPLKVEAKSYSFEGYYCDAKQSLGDGTFKEVCHILVTSDFDVNHIKLNLILKNVVLDSVKTNGSWVNKNGLSNTMEFTSTKSYNGSFSVADLVFIGNDDDTECEASIEPKLIEKTTEGKVCAIIDDAYYGKNGNKVTEEEYYEECCNYVCSVVDDKYYFDSKGNSVSYDAFVKDCGTIEGPQTAINYGFIILPVGIIGMFLIVKFAKKNTKIYKI